MPSIDVVISPDGTEHTRSTYNRKKHGDCEYCKQANRQYIARKKSDNRRRTQTETARYHAEGGQGGIPSIPHGRPAGYEWYGCTEPCCMIPAKERWNRHRQYRKLLDMINQPERKAVNG